MCVVRKCFSVFVEPVHTAAIRSNPKVTLIILNYAFYKIMAKAVAVGNVVFIYGEAITIIRVYAILCAKPHEAPAVLQNAGNITL
jgi:hypothetical protein